MEIHEIYLKAAIDHLLHFIHPVRMAKRKSHSREGRSRLSLDSRRRLRVVGGIVYSLSGLSRRAWIVRAWISSSVTAICAPSFFKCKSLTLVSFELNSQLSRIEREAFEGNGSVGLKSIHLPDL
jgi:hypothetical protein